MVQLTGSRTLPASSPMIPNRFGPCMLGPFCVMVWHDAHLALNSLAPFLASPVSGLTSFGGPEPGGFGFLIENRPISTAGTSGALG